MTSNTPPDTPPSAADKARRRRRGGRGRSADRPADRAAAEVDVPFPDAERQLLTLPPALVESVVASPTSMMTMPMQPLDEQKLALFIDVENVVIGLRDTGHPRFDVKLLISRLLEKGKIVIKRAYADWTRYSEYKRAFHESAFELIEIPQHRLTGKNSADIRMVVDAMDLASNKEHINVFVIGSGDSDFSPLVSKLKENDKRVLGFGVKGSTSELLIDNCDEFIYYEDLVRETAKVSVTGLTAKAAEVFQLLIDSIYALKRESKEILWGSMVKQTMQRKNPSFAESYYGYRTFSELLEAAEKQRFIVLKRDAKSGTYIVTGVGPGGQ